MPALTLTRVTDRTLQAASLVVFGEYSWTPGEMVQAEDRAHRIGQAQSVNVHYLHVKRSIDDMMWQSLATKLDNVGQVMIQFCASGSYLVSLNGIQEATLSLDSLYATDGSEIYTVVHFSTLHCLPHMHPVFYGTIYTNNSTMISLSVIWINATSQVHVSVHSYPMKPTPNWCRFASTSTCEVT